MSHPVAATIISDADKPGSIRSIASISSLASGTSLARRARTRTRSKTVTGASSALPENVPNKELSSELPYLVTKPYNDQNLLDPTTSPPAERPPRSPQSVATITADPGTGQKQAVDHIVSEPANISPADIVEVKTSKATALGSTLPRLTTTTQRNPVSGTIFRASTLPQLISSGIPMRDSSLSHGSQPSSSLSSSLYPPSTSTGTESPPSPRSLAEQEYHNGVSSYDPEVEELEGFDGDDVSYRLRLLVNNNYFLPPAHSKPLPSDFITAPKKAARPTAPTFFDLFRRSKSKPPSPNEPPDHLAPILRTTSDSTTASGYAPRPPPRILPQTPLSPPHVNGTPQERIGRVVVVREKMADIVVAAKQAEQDMKARGIRRDQDSQRAQESFDDVIDPTDAVDIPPLSSGYPFAAQTSAIHGFGVHESVGAALLADALPPAHGPHMYSLDSDDETWRKALLQAAVGHSLNNSPNTSGESYDISSLLPSPRLTRPRAPSSPSGSIRTKRLLGQHITTQPIIEAKESPTLQLTPRRVSLVQSQSRGRGLSTPETHSTISNSRPSSFFPLRAETPLAPQTPLSPAPRKQLINPLYSLSQSDLSSAEHHMPPGPSRLLRKTMSSPMLSDAYESQVRRDLTMTPPPVPSHNTYAKSASTQRLDSSSFDTARESVAASFATSESHYSNDDNVVPRPSMSYSVPTDGRPSLSEYSQPSPTASAFQDALNGPYQPVSSFRIQSREIQTIESVDQQARFSRDSHAPRYSTMSPPPRVSSSLANIALSPPPRSSSFRHKPTLLRMSPDSRAGIPSPDLGHNANSHPLGAAVPILAPEPTTPPFPNPERRTSPPPLSLSISTEVIPVAIHSAPSSSPTSYFDTIQMHPNAMDDLDSSDESDDDEVEAEQSTSLFIDPKTRATSNVPSLSTPGPSIMRLGNHSTPYISRVSEDRRPSLPFGVNNGKMPIGNVPVRGAFFSDRKSGKSDQGHAPPISTFDFYRYAQQHPISPGEGLNDVLGRRPVTAGIEGIRSWQRNQRVQESARRLDGMLIQHMEAEKDTIKRIATTLKHSSQKT